MLVIKITHAKSVPFGFLEKKKPSSKILRKVYYLYINYFY